jgi:hypothetical protein
MKITDEDCLAETLEFNRKFTAEEKPLEVLRRNRLGGDTPPVRSTAWLRNTRFPPHSTIALRPRGGCRPSSARAGC